MSKIDATDDAERARIKNHLLFKKNCNFETIVAFAISDTTYAIVDVNNMLEVINVTFEKLS